MLVLAGMFRCVGYVPGIELELEYQALPSARDGLVLDEAASQGLAMQSGPIWTTDALYRETALKIRQFQDAGVHAVDMEMAALFAVAQYRGCDVGAILIVSDECYHPTWQPGFHAPHFRQGCRDAVALSIAAANRAAELA